MKTLVQLSLLPALGFVLLSGDAQAVTASAAFCKAIFPSSSFVYSAMGFANLGTSDPPPPITCIIPMDNTALGSTVTFEVRGYDNSNTQGFNCNAAISNEMGGTALASTPTAQTSGNSYVGAFNRTWTATVAGTNVNTNMYAIYCSMPGTFSVIYSARAQ